MWMASTDDVGVTGYDIFRDGTKVASVSALIFTDTSLAAATSYTFNVAARDTAGNVSAQSAGLHVTTLASTLPSPTFSAGARVQTLDALNVRSKAGISSKVKCVQPSGALGTLKGAPTERDGYRWWNVNFDSGCDGWSVQNYLALLPLAESANNIEDLLLQALAAIKNVQEELQDLLVSLGSMKARLEAAAAGAF